jgi:hypothetical protein
MSDANPDTLGNYTWRNTNVAKESKVRAPQPVSVASSRRSCVLACASSPPRLAASPFP